MSTNLTKNRKRRLDGPRFGGDRVYEPIRAETHVFMTKSSQKSRVYDKKGPKMDPFSLIIGVNVCVVRRFNVIFQV